MRTLKFVLAAAVLAASGAAFADPQMAGSAPAMTAHTSHVVKTRTVTTRRVTHTDAVPAAVHVTVNTNAHHRMMKHCHRHMKNGHRVRTCVTSRM